MKASTRILRVVRPENGGPRKRTVLVGLAEYHGAGEKLVDGMIKAGELAQYGTKRGSTWGLPRAAGARRQRGFTLAHMVLALLILAAVAAIVTGVRGYLEGIATEAKAAGRTEVLAEVAERDKSKLIAANAEIRRLTDLVRNEEARQAEAIAAATGKHIKEKNDAQANLANLRAAVRDGSLVLHDPGAEAWGRCPGSGGGAAGAPAADPAGGPGRDGGGTLSDQAADFLLVEAARADAVLLKLRLCRATLKAERPPALDGEGSFHRSKLYPHAPVLRCGRLER